MQNHGPRIVAIAASAGGLRAIGTVISLLPADFPAVVMALQHRSDAAPGYLCEILASRGRLPVGEARDGERLQPGAVYVCPAGRHARVAPGGVLALGDGPKVNFARPSADALFESVARSAGPRAVGVVLTGRGRDGAAGAAEIRRRGGIVLVQQPSTCVAASMPEAVLGACGADFVLPPDKIAHALVSLVMAPSVSAALFGIPIAA